MSPGLKGADCAARAAYNAPTSNRAASERVLSQPPGRKHSILELEEDFFDGVIASGCARQSPHSRAAFLSHDPTSSLNRQPEGGAHGSDLYAISNDLSAVTKAAELLNEVERRFRRGVPSGNRRRNKRLPFPAPVVAHRSNRQATELGPPEILNGRDLSLWGISMFSSERFKVGNHLVLSFYLPTDAKPRIVRMLAEVRHLEEDLAENAWIVGCEFRETLREMST